MIAAGLVLIEEKAVSSHSRIAMPFKVGEQFRRHLFFQVGKLLMASQIVQAVDHRFKRKAFDA